MWDKYLEVRVELNPREKEKERVDGRRDWVSFGRRLKSDRGQNR